MEPVLFHLPLNLIWRLPGWNSTLNRVLSSELLWRLKCEQEFPILRGKKPPCESYRYYYLMCSRNVYGQLYREGERVEGLSRVRCSYSSRNYSAHLQGNELHILDYRSLDTSDEDDEQPQEVVHTIFQDIVYMRDDFVRDSSGRCFRIIEEKDITLEPLPFSGRMTAYFNTFKETARLYEDGTLVIEARQPTPDYSNLIVHGVVDFRCTNKWIVLMIDGTVNKYLCINHESRSKSGRYISLNPSLCSLSGRTIDGFEVSFPRSIRFSNYTTFVDLCGVAWKDDGERFELQPMYKGISFLDFDLVVACTRMF